MRNSQIINDADIFDPVLAPHLGLSRIMDKSIDSYATINADAFREKTSKTDDRMKEDLEEVEKSKDQKPFLFKNKTHTRRSR